MLSMELACFAGLRAAEAAAVLSVGMISIMDEMGVRKKLNAMRDDEK